MSAIMFRTRAPKIPNTTRSHASKTTSPPPPSSLHSVGSYQISNSSTLTLSDFDTDLRKLPSCSSSLSVTPPILRVPRHFCYTDHLAFIPSASDHQKNTAYTSILSAIPALSPRPRPELTSFPVQELPPNNPACICICDRTRGSWSDASETTAEVLSRSVHITHQVLEDKTGLKSSEYTFTCLVCRYTDTYTAPRLRRSPLQEKSGLLDGAICTRCSRPTSKVKTAEEIEGLCRECTVLLLYRFIAKHVEEFDIGVAGEKKMGVRGWFRRWLCIG